MSGILIFAAGVCAGCLVGVCIMALMQAGRTNRMKKEREEHERSSDTR